LQRDGGFACNQLLSSAWQAKVMARFFGIFAVAALLATPVSANIMTGPAQVIDGDTLDMTGMRIRLVGIDAPEAGQSCTRSGEAWACGAEATAALQEIIAGQSLTCTARGTDVYGRTLATCQTRILDLGREMVRRGLALALDDAAPDYEEAERLARSLRFGLWDASFQTPREWRAARQAEAPVTTPRERAPRPAASASAAPQRVPASIRDGHGRCAIKGNRTTRGEWIYHLPGQTYYHQTRPEELFCSESAAMAAGYRRSKV
jgi:endonuclease YncB( thermonuclease family)